MRKFNQTDVRSVSVAMKRWRTATTHPEHLLDTVCDMCEEYCCSDPLQGRPTCPIMEVTGREACRGTPYNEYLAAAPGTPEERLAIGRVWQALHEVLMTVYNNLEE